MAKFKIGVIPWNKGKKGLQKAWNKGKKSTEITKQKMSQALKGRKSWNKGKKWSEEVRKKISESNKGKISWNKGIKTGIKPMLGKKHTKEVKQKMKKNLKRLWSSEKYYKKMVEAHKGHKVSEETKRKIGKAHKGRKKSPLSEEHKKKISESKKGWKMSERQKEFLRNRFAKEKHPQWQGGISFEPYTIDWTQSLKKSIRQRDKYTCQICGKEPAICVHHIDYCKKNCNPDNLITLCRNCHTKTNFNREYWIKYFLN